MNKWMNIQNCYLSPQIPAPLTEEMEQEKKKKEAEKKKAKTKVKQEQMKVRKVEEAKLRTEQKEKDRFLHLSDREKVRLRNCKLSFSPEPFFPFYTWHSEWNWLVIDGCLSGMSLNPMKSSCCFLEH